MSSKSWIFEFSRGQKPPIKGGYMWPTMPIFELGLTIPVKSCVRIWFGLVEPFKSYHLNFCGGRTPPIRGVACDLQCPFSDLAELFSSKVICVNLVRIGWAFKSYRVHKHFSMGQKPPIRGGYIWPVMPIFELGWAIPVKSHVWKFGLDWLKSEVC